MGKISNMYFTQEDIWRANKYIKRCSILSCKLNHIQILNQPPLCPLPAFCRQKNLSERVSLIRESRKCRSQGKRSRPNNNRLVTKQSQGLLVPPQGLQIIFRVISFELLQSLKLTPSRWKMLTQRPNPCHNIKLPQFSELASQKWENNQPWN